MTNPVPEMPDCRLCEKFTIDFHGDEVCTLSIIDDYECTNGSEFKPAEKIRLYQITSEDKTT